MPTEMPKFDSLSREVEFALEVMRTTVPLARRIQREMTGKELTKKDLSPVTVADFSIQAVVGYLLSRAFPKDALIAEESSLMLQEADQKEALADVVRYVRGIIPEASACAVCQWIDKGTVQSAERFWVLDPIDGTKGFLRNAQYVVALALIERGQVRLGALGCPHLKVGCQPDEASEGSEGSIVLAVQGKGAWSLGFQDATAWSRLKVSSRKDPQEAVILGSVEAGHTNQSKQEDVLRYLNIKRSPILMDSQAKYAVLAGGIGDFFLYLLPAKDPGSRMKIWDVAPGAIVVEEAGGKATDLLGEPLDFSLGRKLVKNPGILVSNKHLHPFILKSLSVNSCVPI